MKSTVLFASLAICFTGASTASSAADPMAFGSSSYTAGQYAEAKKQFLLAAKRAPRSWKAQYQLANTYVQLKESAAAKKAYQTCLSLHPPADIKDNCSKAITFLGTNDLKTPPPAAVAPAQPWHVQQVGPSSSTPTSSSSAPASSAAASSGSSAPASPTNSGNEALKKRIMDDAQEQIAKIKAQAKEQLEEAKANSSQRYMSDNGVVTGISTEEEAAIMRDADGKAARIMEEAKRRVSGLH
jgi:tetratricopeptide (TPR) repeat protein